MPSKQAIKAFLLRTLLSGTLCSSYSATLFACACNSCQSLDGSRFNSDAPVLHMVYISTPTDDVSTASTLAGRQDNAAAGTSRSKLVE